MKSNLSKAVLVLTCVFSSVVLAEPESPATLSTTGFGQVVALPDMAEFTVAIQAEQSQAKAAKQAVDKVVTQFLTSLEGQGIKRADIVSGNLQVLSQYQYPHRPNRLEQDKKLIESHLPFSPEF